MPPSLYALNQTHVMVGRIKLAAIGEDTVEQKLSINKCISYTNNGIFKFASHLDRVWFVVICANLALPTNFFVVCDRHVLYGYPKSEWK